MEINYLAILVSGIASIVIGGLWYGPLFGKQWMKMAGIECDPATITAQQKAMMWKGYVVTFLASLVMAYVFASTLAAFGAAGASMALQGAFWIWVGFFVPVALSPILWEQKPWKMFFINIGHSLVSLGVIALILTLWK